VADGTVVAITGASRGLGRAIALRFARAGARLGLTYLNTHGTLDEITALARTQGGDAIAIEADLSKPDGGRPVIAQTEARFGRIDVLVNNASVLDILPSVAMDWATWERTIAVNLGATWSTIHAALPGMLARRSGRIINISSVSGVTGTPEHAAYSAAKAGVNGLTKALAAELTGKGILINAIAPGPMDTDMLAATGRFPKEVVATFPLKRVADPDEIALSVEFLAGPGGRYYAGQVFSPSGGLVYY
jgi:NAD(P)-dependent dehydrogenase (short-subunit alcohol dehydrogenase family)